MSRAAIIKVGFCSNAKCSLHWKNAPLGGPCVECGEMLTPLKRIPRGLRTLQIRGDIPEHYNESLGEVVKSGRHLRDLQKIHGTQDFDPANSKNPLKMVRR